MNGKFKHDQRAAEIWGIAYATIPKSVFAMAAWHLSDCCSEEGVGQGYAEKRFAEEVAALRDNGLISTAQAKRVLAAISKAQS